jgi:hypothetical protein
MDPKPLKTVSHLVTLGYLADVQYCLNLYAALFTGMGITNTILQVPAAGPAHPIETEATRINSAFFRDMQTFKQLTISKVNVHVVSATVNGFNLHFMIGYNEPY